VARKAFKNTKKNKSPLSEDVRNELDGMPPSGLHKVIADAEEAIAQATKERDGNEKYQQAKQAVSDLSLGLKDLKKYQGAKIKYSLRRLRELRGEDCGDEE
jgi:hypothetical protein